MSKKIKLKDSIYVLIDNQDVYHIIFTSTRIIRKFKFDDLTKDLIFRIQKNDNFEGVIDDVRSKYRVDDITSCINTLQNFGILDIYGDNYNNPRFQRQFSFINELTQSWEETVSLQKRLEESTIAIFGVGGIGSWIVNSLNQIGVGNLRIIDPDVIEESNLNRQLFLTSEDIGKYKVDVIKSKLKNVNVTSYKLYVSPNEDLEGIINGCNFVVNCADQPSIAETTSILNKYCSRMNIPYCVSGGYNLHLGMIGPIIIPGKTACFDCFLKYQQENDPLKGLTLIKDIKTTGSLGPIAGTIANIQAMEIFKFIIGKGEININRFAEIDFMNLSIEWKYFNRRSDCPHCGTK